MSGCSRSDKEAVAVQHLPQKADVCETMRTGPAQSITCSKNCSQPPVICISETPRVRDHRLKLPESSVC